MLVVTDTTDRTAWIAAVFALFLFQRLFPLTPQIVPIDAGRNCIPGQAVFALELLRCALLHGKAVPVECLLPDLRVEGLRPFIEASAQLERRLQDIRDPQVAPRHAGLQTTGSRIVPGEFDFRMPDLFMDQTHPAARLEFVDLAAPLIRSVRLGGECPHAHVDVSALPGHRI